MASSSLQSGKVTVTNLFITEGESQAAGLTQIKLFIATACCGCRKSNWAAKKFREIHGGKAYQGPLKMVAKSKPELISSLGH